MPTFECDSCGKRHRQYDRWLKCQDRKVRSECDCPPHWKKRLAEPDPKRRWVTHAVGCPMKKKGDD